VHQKKSNTCSISSLDYENVKPKEKEEDEVVVLSLEELILSS
jgi:hypothetical protein